jgi:hypothetical protein
MEWCVTRCTRRARAGADEPAQGIQGLGLGFKTPNPKTLTSPACLSGGARAATGAR